jgi:hypothetical protein
MTECKYYSRVCFEYTCAFRDQRNIDHPIILIGEHWSEKTNADVTELRIERCDFLTYPQNLQVLFPNLKLLFIKNCNLEHIGNEHIGKWKKMTHIVVTKCKLRRLEGDLLSGLEELVCVNFRGNEIEEIEPEIIDDLRRLIYVNLQINTNIDSEYSQYDDHTCVLEELIEDIRVKCKPKAQRKVINELQKNMQTLAASLKQTLQLHEESTNERLQKIKSIFESQQEASRVLEEKLMVEINNLKLAQRNQNKLLDEHKKTIEELQNEDNLEKEYDIL